MTNERPCQDCGGRGWDSEGYICSPCDGTGRHSWRYIRTWIWEDEQENISLKVRAECNLEKKREQEKRRAELDDYPELKARVEEVEQMFQQELDEHAQFARGSGPAVDRYREWKRAWRDEREE